MSGKAASNISKLRANDSYAEQRADLAAAFRWTVKLGMHEAVANHMSLAVTEDGKRFLMNPNGRHFGRVRASDLILLDADDPDTMNAPDAPDPTAWFLHGAIHRNVKNAACVLHVHSKYALALACLEDKTLPPIDQNSMRFYNRVIIDDDYGGMGLGDEAERVSRGFADNPGKPVMVMGNHGVMVIGGNVPEAFDLLYYFERSCETYITALSTGRPLRIASDAVARKTCQQWLDYSGAGDFHFREIRNILNEEGSDYRD